MQTQLLGTSNRYRLCSSGNRTLSQLPRFQATSTLQPVFSNSIKRHYTGRSCLVRAAKSVEAEIVQDDSALPNFQASHDQITFAEDEGLVSRLLKGFMKIAAVGALCLVLAFATVNPALAAGSGGRAGGSAFSSAGARGYSGGGLSSGGGRGFSSSAGSSSSMFGGGMRGSPLLGGGMMQRSPSVSINSFGWYGSPVYGGFGGGYAAPVVSTGGGGLFSVLFLALFAAVAFSVVNGGFGSESSESTGERVTVAKLQVGLLGSARQLQRDLDRIASRADTTDPSGLHYILQETVLSLLRHPDYCIYGQGSISKQRGLEAGESKFNSMSMEERSKVKEETLVNVGGRSKSSSYSSGSSATSAGNELIVVTILVAAEGAVQIPKVTSLEELRSALQTLGGISEAQTLAVEVLWTPQDVNDHYTRDDMMHDFPTLNSL